MKKTRLLLLPLIAAGALSAQAQQEMGRVVSTTPIMTAVSVPQQVCTQQQVVTPGQKSGAGAVLGAIAGGAIGNQVGQGSGRALATGVGLIGGAMLGNNIEGAGPAQAQTVQNCTTQNVIENRITAYNVTYEYAGKQYTVQMPQDPGPYVRLQITPIGGSR